MSNTVLTLFPPDQKPLNFDGVTSVEVDNNGVLIFYSKPDSSLPRGRKITTSLPFMFTEEVNM